MWFLTFLGVRDFVLFLHFRFPLHYLNDREVQISLPSKIQTNLIGAEKLIT